MLTQPRKRVSTLALLDPEIPGGRLLDDGAWGINLAAAQLNFPDRGLKVQIPAWSSMSKGDNCKLLLDKSMVAQKTITEDIDVGERVTLFVPPLRLLTGEWELTYEVKRISQAVEPGPVLKLFVKLELPAGQDTNPGYGHSNLSMTFDPPDVVRDGVDKDTAEEGVLVYVKPKPDNGLPYENVAVGDVITLAWAGKTVASEPVTQDNIDDPEGYPIVALADEATIRAAGDSEGVSVSYKIRDRVYNESEDWCEAVSIAVDTQGLRLGAPILEQADGLTLDLERLGDNLPRVQVWAEDPNIFKQNDDIVVLVTGTTLEGKEISVTVTQRIQTTPPVRVTIEHSNSALRALAKRTAVYSYKVLRAGVPIENHQSKSRAYSVIGEPTRLAAPIALDDIGGAIDPDLKQYRIRIPYDPLITADKMIEFEWLGTRPDLTTYDPELEWFPITEDEANDPNGFVITVEGEHGKTLEGGTLKLSYILLADEGNDVISRRPSLPASQLNVGEPQRELVKPIVLGEQDGALEPADLPGGIGKVTAPRPIAVPTESGDIVTLTWIGEVSGADGDSKTLNALSKDKDVVFTLNADFVAKNIEANRGKKVTVSYRIDRAASDTTSYSNELEFVIGEPVVLDPPTIDSVKGSASGDEIAEGATIVETSVDLSGTAAKGKDVAILDGAEVKGTAIADPVSGIWTFTASGLSVSAHSFTVKETFGEERPSAARGFVVTALIVPTLSNVLDEANKEVLEGATTVSTSLTLKGTASKGQDLEIFEGTGSSAVSKGPATADEMTGVWESEVAVEAGARRVYAKSLYHSTAVYSNARTMTVVLSSAPILSSVKGSPSGEEIVENGFTVETSVILSGLATIGREIEVLDDVTFKGKTTADNETGIWTVTVADLSRAKHSFTARDVSQPTLVSPARTLTITEVTAPTLSSIKGSPSNSEIAENGYTAETAITVSGIAAKGQKIEIFDNNVSSGTATADATGLWEKIITGLSTTTHSFNIKSLYEPEAWSENKVFNVLPAFFTERFEQFPAQVITTLDTTYMVITSSRNGRSYAGIAKPVGASRLLLHAFAPDIASTLLTLRVPCSRVRFQYSQNSNEPLTAVIYGDGATPVKTLSLPNYLYEFVCEEPDIRRIELKLSSASGDKTAYMYTFEFTAKT